ncbi:MAG: nuclear transport factor 2 family protein [Jatrophihabitans sp.]
MDPVDVVTELWARIDERDWPGLGEVLAEDVVIEWPVSRELIRGRGNVVAVNAEYPEGWSIRVIRVIGSDEQVASEVEVPIAGLGTFRVASFWTVAQSRVTWAREYWTSLGADEAPSWRRGYTETL